MPLHVVFITFSRQVLRWQTSAVCRVVPGARSPEKFIPLVRGDTKKMAEKSTQNDPNHSTHLKFVHMLNRLNLKKTFFREAISLDFCVAKNNKKKHGNFAH